MSTPNDPMPYMSPPPTRALAHTATRRTERANEDDKAAEHARTTGCAWLAEKIATDVTVASGRRPREMGDQTRWSGQEIPETFARLAWHPTQTRLSPLGHIERGGTGHCQRVWASTLRLTAGNPRKLALRESKGLACVRACLLSGWLAGEGNSSAAEAVQPESGLPLLSMGRVPLFLPARDYFAHVCFVIPRDRRAPGREIGSRRVSGVRQPGLPGACPPRGCRLISGRLGFG